MTMKSSRTTSEIDVPVDVRVENYNLKASKENIEDKSILIRSSQHHPLAKEEQPDKKFEISRKAHDERERQQKEVLDLFPQTKRFENSLEAIEDFIEIMPEDEYPSQETIALERGDSLESDNLLLDSSIQQAQNYMRKYKDYFHYLEGLRILPLIPSDPEKSLMLEHFKKYLDDGRYYLKFFEKYSKFWRQEQNKLIVPYKGGLFVPIDRQIGVYHYSHNNPDHTQESHLFEAESLSKWIYEDFHKGREVKNLEFSTTLPELARLYAKSTFVPEMTVEDMNALYYTHQSASWKPNLPLTTSCSSKSYSSKGNENMNGNLLEAFLSRKNLLYFLNHNEGSHKFFTSLDFHTEALVSYSANEFVELLEKLLATYHNIKCLWILHSRKTSDSILQYTLFVALAILLGIPFFTVVGDIINEDALPRPQDVNRDFIVTNDLTILDRYGETHQQSNNILYYGPLEPSPSPPPPPIYYDGNFNHKDTGDKKTINHQLNRDAEAFKASFNCFLFKRTIDNCKHISLDELNHLRQKYTGYQQTAIPLSYEQGNCLARFKSSKILLDHLEKLEKLILPCKCMVLCMSVHHPLHTLFLLLIFKHHINSIHLSEQSSGIDCWKCIEEYDPDVMICNIHQLIQIQKLYLSKTQQQKNNVIPSKIFSKILEMFEHAALKYVILGYYIPLDLKKAMSGSKIVLLTFERFFNHELTENGAFISNESYLVHLNHNRKHQEKIQLSQNHLRGLEQELSFYRKVKERLMRGNANGGGISINHSVDGQNYDSVIEGLLNELPLVINGNSKKMLLSKPLPELFEYLERRIRLTEERLRLLFTSLEDQKRKKVSVDTNISMLTLDYHPYHQVSLFAKCNCPATPEGALFVKNHNKQQSTMLISRYSLEALCENYFANIHRCCLYTISSTSSSSSRSNFLKMIIFIDSSISVSRSVYGRDSRMPKRQMLDEKSWNRFEQVYSKQLGSNIRLPQWRDDLIIVDNIRISALKDFDIFQFDGELKMSRVIELCGSSSSSSSSGTSNNKSVVNGDRNRLQNVIAAKQTWISKL